MDTSGTAARFDNMNTIYATDPNTATVRLGWTYTNKSGSTRAAYFQLNFITSGSFPTSYTQANFIADVQIYLLPLKALWCWNSGPPLPCYWNITTPTQYKQTGAPLFWNPPFFRTPRLAQNGAVFTLRTALTTKNGTGRIHLPWLQDTDAIGSKISPSFKTKAAPFIALLEGNHTMGTVLFKPCVWSRQLGNYYPIDKVDLLDNVGWLRKRRPKAFRRYTQVPWPSIW